MAQKMAIENQTIERERLKADTNTTTTLTALSSSLSSASGSAATASASNAVVIDDAAVICVPYIYIYLYIYMYVSIRVPCKPAVSRKKTFSLDKKRSIRPNHWVPLGILRESVGETIALSECRCGQCSVNPRDDISG
jgi:hypothetical protein